MNDIEPIFCRVAHTIATEICLNMSLPDLI